MTGPQQERCPNTVHSNYVTDHRCQRERGHDDGCLFGAVTPWIAKRELEAYERGYLAGKNAELREALAAMAKPRPPR